MKKVVNGIYETSKMKVEIDTDFVAKTFKNVANSNTRYRREKEALQRLSGIPNFPQLMAFNDTQRLIKMSRLAGDQLESLSVNQIELLRKMVEQMFEAGVARHALPIRDLVGSNNDDTLGMVDFERITLRYFRFSLFWLIAKKVTYYHLYRLIDQHQPQLLAEPEKQLLAKGNKIRSLLK